MIEELDQYQKSEKEELCTCNTAPSIPHTHPKHKCGECGRDYDDQPIENNEYYVANCACCNKGLTNKDDKILSNYHFDKTDTLCSNCAKQDLAVAHQEAMNTSYYRKQELQEKIKQELIKKLEKMKDDREYNIVEVFVVDDCIEAIKHM